MTLCIVNVTTEIHYCSAVSRNYAGKTREIIIISVRNNRDLVWICQILETFVSVLSNCATVAAECALVRVISNHDNKTLDHYFRKSLN